MASQAVSWSDDLLEVPRVTRFLPNCLVLNRRLQPGHYSDIMGQKQMVYVQPLPEKTLKEKVKEFSRSINKLKREFQREVYKFQANDRKMTGDLERMVKKNEPAQSKRIVAQNILRNQKFMRKYQKLDVQLEDMLFQLNSVATTETLVGVMRGMAQMMGKANQAMNVKSIQQALMMFQTEMERGAIMGEQIEDVMNMGEEEIDDQSADTLIAQMELNAGGSGKGGQGFQTSPNNQYLTDFEGRLNKI